MVVVVVGGTTKSVVVCGEIELRIVCSSAEALPETSPERCAHRPATPGTTVFQCFLSPVPMYVCYCMAGIVHIAEKNIYVDPSTKTSWEAHNRGPISDVKILFKGRIELV